MSFLIKNFIKTFSLKFKNNFEQKKQNFLIPTVLFELNKIEILYKEIKTCYHSNFFFKVPILFIYILHQYLILYLTQICL